MLAASAWGGGRGGELAEPLRLEMCLVEEVGCSFALLHSAVDVRSGARRVRLEIVDGGCDVRLTDAILQCPPFSVKMVQKTRRR